MFITHSEIKVIRLHKKMELQSWELRMRKLLLRYSVNLMKNNKSQPFILRHFLGAWKLQELLI